jgi:hypothetical protein
MMVGSTNNTLIRAYVASRWGGRSRRRLFGQQGGEICTHPSKGVAAHELVAAERNFAEVCFFASLLAELAAPPAVRHHAETSATMIAALSLSHHALEQQVRGISLR